MKTKPCLTMVLCLCAFVSASLGGLRDQSSGNEVAGHADKDAENLRKRLIGTSWKAAPIQLLRGGLAPILTFTAETIAPAGYLYEVSGADRVTIHFKKGDTQDMQLSPDGRRLTFTFAEKAYAYELLDTAGKVKMELDGTSWKAMPDLPLRGGLSAVLTFSDDTVGPAGYRYDVNSEDSITIHFSHGDTQLMLRSTNGRQLTFIFGGKTYAYELMPR
jgi:hypothetical protein